MIFASTEFEGARRQAHCGEGEVPTGISASLAREIVLDDIDVICTKVRVRLEQ